MTRHLVRRSILMLIFLAFAMVAAGCSSPCGGGSEVSKKGLPESWGGAVTLPTEALVCELGAESVLNAKTQRSVRFPKQTPDETYELLSKHFLGAGWAWKGKGLGGRRGTRNGAGHQMILKKGDSQVQAYISNHLEYGAVVLTYSKTGGLVFRD